jgi:hypothetical protein
MSTTNLRTDGERKNTVSFRVDIDDRVRDAIARMAGGRRQAQFLEDVVPVIAQEFERVLEGKADPFDPMTKALLPYVELYRQRKAGVTEQGPEAS